MSEEPKQEHYLDLVANMVSAYVSNNSVPVTELPALIHSVHAALSNTAKGASETPKEELTPAVAIKKSITPDYLICLEDGKKFKSLKRHLRTQYNFTPEQYRSRWSLPMDYPMVAPNYAQARSELAKSMGLGRKAAGRKKSKKAA